ncbi:MAG: ABC transporter ATP-binding protein [Chthoniobacter sp.]
MSAVIKLENLGKRYRLGDINRRMLYEDMQRFWARLRGKPDPFGLVGGPEKKAQATGSEEIWALKNVNLEIRDGDVVGIIGRNGSGKSTLLKILSKITAPTEGRALIKGRIASLLEVGTGFHSELTGRENVYMNAAILGMTKAETDQKFDEIVDFSGVEKFIDTPVKRYSSGMMVRLAFAVAAHIEPEILIIDEVLAVGDAAFQKKCLGKVSEVAREGRTVLFVSHQAAAVENLCTRGVVLAGGRVAFQGTQTEALGFYADSFGHFTGDLRDRADRKGSGELQVVAIEMRKPDGERVNSVATGQDIDLVLHFENHAQQPWPELKVYIDVKNQFDIPLFRHGNLYTGDSFGAAMPSRGALVCRLRKLPLPAGSYRINYLIRTTAHRSVLLDQIEAAIDLHVDGGDFYGTGRVPSVHDASFLVDGDWRLETEAPSNLVRPIQRETGAVEKLPV